LKSLGHLTAALPTLTIKDEKERESGQVLLASLEATKSETTRALASLAAGVQQPQQQADTNAVVGQPASNVTVAGGVISGGSETIPSLSGGAAVDVAPSATVAVAAAAAAPVIPKAAAVPAP